MRRSSTTVKLFQTLLRVLLVADVIMLLLYGITRNVGDHAWVLYRAFDLNGEGNVAAWYASWKWSMAFVIVSLLVVARSARQLPGEQLVRYTLSALFLMLACDEIAQLHEWFGRMLDRFLIDRRDTVMERTHYWMIAPSLVLMALAVWVHRTVRRRSLTSTRLLLGGFGLLIVGGAGIEMLSNFASDSSTTLLALIAIEETLENMGATLSVVAMAAYVSASGVRLAYQQSNDSLLQFNVEHLEMVSRVPAKQSMN